MAGADAILAKARSGDAEAFRALTDPYRAELQAHCYRILGSLQDAEDVVQETLLAAWRALRSFEGRSSPRAWLTMPPQPLEYEGPVAIRAFLSSHPWWGSAGVRLVPTRANGQPALALYLEDASSAAPALNGLLVLTVEGERISAIARFGRDGIHPAFGLPALLND
jgi:hypothetical protein